MRGGGVLAGHKTKTSSGLRQNHGHRAALPGDKSCGGRIRATHAAKPGPSRASLAFRLRQAPAQALSRITGGVVLTGNLDDPFVLGGTAGGSVSPEGAYSSAMSQPFPSIADYGLIGDTRSAALVSRTGAMDWLCWPRFDSPALFLALLDRERGGACTVEAAEGGRALEPAGRRYLPQTNILETTLVVPGEGRCVVTDFMPVRARPREEVSRGEERSSGADGRLVRRIACTDGEVAVRAVVRPAFNYGRASALLTPHDGERSAVFRTSGGPPQGLVMYASGPLALDPRAGQATLPLRLRAGEEGFVALTEGAPGRVPALDAWAAVEKSLQETLSFWQEWSQRCSYDGPCRDAVLRSLLVLKALIYMPSGGIVAAPTLGLPETLGGRRNYDYRYSWLRDAGFTARGLLAGGYRAESVAYLRFLVRNAGGCLEHTGKLRVLYGITEPAESFPVSGEETLDHLTGYGGARPVSVGNRAREQDQHDIYGEALNALSTFVERTGELPRVADDARENQRQLAVLVRGLAKAIVERWRGPDSGIWEMPGKAQHFFHSKALCWLGLDRAVGLAPRLGLEGEAAPWARERDAIRTDYLAKGWNARRNAYTQAYGSDELDAAVLRPVLFGALEAADPRVQATLATVTHELGAGPEKRLLRRYRPGSDGLPGTEGAFVACAFWTVGCLALAGQTRKAQTRFEELLTLGNDLGLFSEEIDPETGELLGNFPQAFTHMSIVNQGTGLQQCLERFGLR